VVLNAEDGAGDTMALRLLALGADPDRVLLLNTVPDTLGLSQRPIVLPGDCGFLRRAIQQVDARLVVVDPLVAFLGAEFNTFKDQDVRRAMLPLAIMADQCGVCVLCVRHLNKSGGRNAIYRGGCSIA